MKSKAKKKLSEKDIDRLIVAQANDDAAWEKPIRVRRVKLATLPFPPTWRPVRRSSPD